MAEPRDQVILGLRGLYCRSCVKSLTDFALAKYAIVPMCREDLTKLLENGDMDRIQKMIEEKETQNGTLAKPRRNP